MGELNDWTAFSVLLSKTNPELFNPKKPVFKLLGGSLDERRSEAEAASPAKYIKDGKSPFLTVNGTRDSIVSIQQSEVLESRLKKAGLDITFIKINVGGYKLEGPEIEELVARFLEKQFE